jgi:hypothetical protein
MSEEKKIDQSIPSQPVEDVFSNVEEPAIAPANPKSQEPIQKNVNISESSIGQEGTALPAQKEKVVSKPMVPNDTKEKTKGFNMGKILFYFILSLIILLGAFAIWALVF